MPALPTDPVSAIEKALARAHSDLPAMAPLLDAFGPILLARARIRQDAPGWQGQPPAFEVESYCQGVSILTDQGFEDMSDLLPGAAASMLPVLARCFPALAEEFQTLGQAVASGAVTGQQLAMAAFGEKLELPGVAETTIAFTSAELVRPFLERQAQDLARMGQDLPWRQATCPVCGSAPNMSVLRPTSEDTEFIKPHGGRRFLRCSCCATEWAYKRVSCPSCGCEEPDDLVVLRDPEREHERADACKRCKSFVLCLDVGELAEIPDTDVAALTMLPLEVQARKEGYKPLGLHPWSGL